MQSEIIQETRIGVAVSPNTYNDILLRYSMQEGGQNPVLFMIHVIKPLTVPNPFGGPGRVPLSQVAEVEREKYSAIREAEVRNFGERLRQICDKIKVKGTFVVVEAEQVGKTLVQQIENYRLSKFIIGRSKSIMAIRATKSDYVLSRAPSHCAVKCVSSSSRVVSFRDAVARISYSTNGRSPQRELTDGQMRTFSWSGSSSSSIEGRSSFEIELRTIKEALQAIDNRLEKQESRNKMDVTAMYTEYSYKELEDVTNNFSLQNKVGEGGYGSVYRGKLRGTDVAVKVLNNEGWQGVREFHREAEVLSRLRHPNIVLLLGGNPNRGCLVYEFMENGNLEDRLQCRNDTLPIPTFTRYTIAVQVAKALFFLHSATPQVVHMDLKATNILLDKNFNSKISDAGLARFVLDPEETMRDTSPVGTLAYIDPIYLHEGTFNAKSDVYAFGIILLQLLTGARPIGIYRQVATAVKEGSLSNLLDPNAGSWPRNVPDLLAGIALQCTSREREDRPEVEYVLDSLQKMETMFKRKEE